MPGPPSARPALVLAHYGGARFFSRRSLDRLDEVGRLLDREPLASWDDPRADRLLAEAEVIVGHWGCPRIDAAVLDRAPRLGLVAYAAGTVREVVDPVVLERGIRVTSGAPANAEPVAEYTLAMVLLAGKDALWPGLVGRRDPAGVPVGNWGKTIGIVGASLVGRRVIELLRAFPHLGVTLYDPFVPPEEAAALGVRKLDLDELCATADVLSIHAPALPSTERMIGARQLAALRTGAVVVNTARGSLVDHDALVAELSTGRLHAILDVTDPEPLPADHPLRTLPNVFLTPHLAGSQGTELHRLADHVTDEIHRWSTARPAANGITLPRWPHLA